MALREQAPLYIDGEFREAADGRRYDVTSPADESVVGSAAEATAADVSAAVGAARRAFDETPWSTDHGLRARCLRQLQEGLRKEAAHLKSAQIAEAGIPAGLGALMDQTIEEITHEVEMIESFAWETDFPAYEYLGMTSLRTVRGEPYGVVAAIVPWNAPTMIALWKCVPALATGNTVVLKSAPETPLAGAILAKIVHEHTDIPPGVFNVLSSSDNAVGGDGLTGDPRVDMFHFTGSSAVGERIAARAAVGVRKVVLELGGKSANILLEDADLDAAVPLSVGMCMLTSGQGCTLGTRLLVPASLYDEVIGRLEQTLPMLPFGDPADVNTVVGPIIRRGQLERMRGLVDRARADGARVVVGGQIDDRGAGFWYPPTLVVDVDENSELAQTEVFGPVLAVLRYDGTDDEAVRIANNTPYGLSGYIQTRDLERAQRIARRLRTGTVNINASVHHSPVTPFGGYGRSGLGREHGLEGWLEFLQSKTIASPASVTSPS
jgi:aldehyde dehydrogenase (NAD+)